MRCVFPVLVDGETSFAICLGELHNRVFYRVFDDDLYPAYRHAVFLVCDETYNLLLGSYD